MQQQQAGRPAAAAAAVRGGSAVAAPLPRLHDPPPPPPLLLRPVPQLHSVQRDDCSGSSGGGGGAVAVVAARPRQRRPRQPAAEVPAQQLLLRGPWPVRADQPRLLTAQITAASGVAELAALLAAPGQQLNAIHVSAALRACVRHAHHLEQQQQQQHAVGAGSDSAQLQQVHALADALVVAIVRQGGLCGGRELATALWCAAKLRRPVPPPVLRCLLARFADVAHAGDPRATATVLYALAALGHRPDAAWLDRALGALAKQAAAAPGAHAQALASTLWALTRLQQPGVARVWLLPLLALLQRESAARAAAGARPPERMQTVATALWAAAALLTGHRELTAAAAPEQPAPPSAHPQLVPAVRRMAARLLEAHADGLAPCAALQPQEVPMVVWACSRLAVAPSRRWCASFWAASGPLLGRLAPRECACVLFGIASLNMQPPAPWLAQLLAVTQPHLASLPAQPLANMLWACGRLRARPPAAWMDAAVAALHAALPDCGPAAACMALVGASKLGYRPPPRVLHGLLDAAASRLLECRPRTLSQMLLACAALRVPPRSSAIGQLLAACLAQLDACGPSDVAMLLRALAKLQQCAAGVSCAPQVAPWSRQQQQQWPHQQQQQQQQQEWWRAALTLPPLPLSMAPTSVGGEGGGSMPAAAQPAGLPPLGDAQLAALLDRAEQLLEAMAPHELCQCSAAAVRLGADLGPRWLAALNHRLPAQLHRISPGDICQLLWALAQLESGGAPVRRLLHRHLMLRTHQLLVGRPPTAATAAAAAAAAAAAQLTPRDLVGFVWGCAAVMERHGGPAPPPAWVGAFCAAARTKLPSFTSRQLSVTLRALVRLQAVVDAGLVEAAALLLELRSAQLTVGELAVTSASLLQLRQLRIVAAEAAAGQQHHHHLHEQQQQQQQQQAAANSWVLARVRREPLAQPGAAAPRLMELQAVPHAGVFAGVGGVR